MIIRVIFLLSQAWLIHGVQRARVSLVPASSDDNVNGELILEQVSPRGPVLIRGVIKGLPTREIPGQGQRRANEDFR